MTPPPASDTTAAMWPSDRLIDTHAHLDAAGGLPAIAQARAGDSEAHVIGVTNLPRHYSRLHKTHHSRVHWALGLHPAQPHPPAAIQDFIALLPSCAAVGEVGLDGSPATSPHSVPMARQREELSQILAHPITARRLVSIHSRRSASAVIEHLQEAAIPGAVLHWFTGTPAQAVKAADAGAYFSVNNRMGRKHDLLAALPRDRVLLETDAPHTGKTLRPGDIMTALAVVADAWQVTRLAAADQILTNQQKLQRVLSPT